MKHLWTRLLFFWNRLLIFLHLRRDWVNETQINPPAFEGVAPHVYDPEMDGKTLTFCAQCGAGPQHRIHPLLRPQSQPPRKTPPVLGADGPGAPGPGGTGAPHEPVIIILDYSAYPPEGAY